MGTYKFLPHTADEKFEVIAPNLSDAFATSVLAFYEIILGPNHVVGEKVTKEISLEAKKLTSLLYDFLNELVFYFDDENLLLQHVKKLIVEPKGDLWILNATLAGESRVKHDLVTEIKNMTYSEMEIKQHTADCNPGSGDDGVRMIVVVDI